MPALTPDAWAQIRYDYEHSDRAIADICAEHGISSGTLRDRMRRWNWRRRREPIPREGPPALAAPESATAPNPWPLGPSFRGDEREAQQPPQTVAAFEISTPDPSPPKGRSRPSSTGYGGGEHSESAASAAALPVASGGNAEADAAQIVPRLQSAVARVLPAIETIIARLAAGPRHPREMEQTARTLGTLTRTLRELNALLSQHPGRAGTGDDDDMPEDIDAFRLDLARRIDAFVASRSGEDDEAAQPGDARPAEP